MNKKFWEVFVMSVIYWTVAIALCIIIGLVIA